MRYYIMFLLIFCGVSNRSNAQSVTLDEVVDMVKSGQDIANISVIIDNLHFQTGKFELNSDAKIILDKVSFVLNKIPTTRLRIEGHTDDVGSKKSNQILSENRAREVKAYLVGQGIYSDRIKYIGLGESMPIYSNKNERGRALNRRVQIVFEELDTRTNNLILRNGTEIPVVIVVILDDRIDYTTKSNNEFNSIPKSQVSEIRYANGNVTKITSSEIDTDGDGVLDNVDECPYKYGSKNNNGCPEIKDSDGDGILDKNDNCPLEYGYARNNGCPEGENISYEAAERDFSNIDLWKSAVGLRLNGDGVGFSFTRNSNSDRSRFQKLIISQQNEFDDLELTAIMGGQRFGNSRLAYPGIYTYWGLGGHGFYRPSGNDFGLGINFIFGFGVQFANIPFSISMDYKPALRLYDTIVGFDPYWSSAGLAVLELKYILSYHKK